jgi:hypothetical protein
MSKNIKLKQNVIIVDSKSGESLGDLVVKVDAYINDPFISLPNQQLNLTAETARFLISQLQIALELIGEDFIVHHNSDISLWRGSENFEYKNLEEYKSDLATA